MYRIDLSYFLSPRTIAIIGASENFTSISGKPLHFLLEHDYKGKIFPVNPKYDTLGGIKCYKSVLDIPEPVDLALLAVNFKLVLPTLKQCAEKKIKFATIFASGFAESGEEGKFIQQQIADLVKESGMRICGPNCQGSVSLKDHAIGGFSASLGVKPLVVGPIGYVTQSGALGYSIFSLAQEAGVGFSYVASTGNEVDLHTLDFMEFILEDADTKMIISYLEGIKDGRQFARLADRALELGKPIVTLKVGRSEVGQKAASSHTASLTGSDAVCDAFFRQKGIIRAHDIEEMIDVAALMQKIPVLPEGKGIGLITTSGGGGILMADEASEMKLDIPELDTETRKILMEVIPPYGSALNPVDVTAQVINQADDFKKVLEVLVANHQIHALIIVITQITGDQGRQMAEDIVEISKQTKKPITVAWTTGDLLVADNLQLLSEGGIQYYKSPVRAVRAMGVLMNYSVFRKEVLSRTTIDLKENKDEKIQEAARSFLDDKQRNLTEYEGKKLLALYGIPVTKEEIASSEKQAVSIAETIGYPVALKINSPDILHKTEAGGLKLNIQNNEDLLAAYNEILINAREYNPNAQLNGILIQEMVRDGIEVIIGVNNNPQFGPTVMFGLGGIFVEILKDVSMRVAPLSFEDAMEMIKEIKGFKVLTGARGRSKADIHAIAGVLVKVSRMALDLEDQIAELDINPLLVMPEGKGVCVADALVLKIK
ncbi:MAG: acetate--CoA ligase family protein [Bacteroidales bacterium]|nr:acetate--CoA ligase family protein [Bacteroidota bacterium]MBL6949674.1 acetate--CoA ligase family protein [Bacteroidales bacterium]